MSHFLTLVLLEPEGAVDVEAAIRSLLAPYDENTDVPEYENPCSCVGDEARDRAREAADKVFGTINDLRKTFADIRSRDWDEDETERRWREHIRPYCDFEKRAFEADPGRDAPKATCGFYTADFCPDGHHPGERFEDGSGCGGTGIVRTTYNPRSKWDWYQVGGRWTGCLAEGYDPEKDRRNIETCWLCKGTGKRPDMDVPSGCNGCDGTGRALKHPGEWVKFSGDVMPVSSLPADCTPFAIVTPDGQWHERGRMGWWAMVSDETPKDEWKSRVADLLSAHQRCLAVAVDCHI